MYCSAKENIFTKFTSIASVFAEILSPDGDRRRVSLLVYVIAWGRGQLRINFTSIFKVFTKLPESRSDEGNLENFENTSEINP